MYTVTYHQDGTVEYRCESEAELRVVAAILVDIQDRQTKSALKTLAVERTAATNGWTPSLVEQFLGALTEKAKAAVASVVTHPDGTLLSVIADAAGTTASGLGPALRVFARAAKECRQRNPIVFTGPNAERVVLCDPAFREMATEFLGSA